MVLWRLFFMRMMADVTESPQAMVHLPWLVPIFCLGHSAQAALTQLPVMKFFLKKCKETSTKKRVSFTFSTKTVGFLNRWSYTLQGRSSPHQVTLETLLSSSMTQKLKQYDISMPKSTSTSEPAEAKAAGSWAGWTLGVQKLVVFWCLFFQKASTKNKKNMFWANRLEGEAFNGIGKIIQAMQLFQDDNFEPTESKSQWRHCQFPWTYSWRFGIERSRHLDDFFCASSTKVWRKQLGLRRIELYKSSGLLKMVMFFNLKKVQIDNPISSNKVSNTT